MAIYYILIASICSVGLLATNIKSKNSRYKFIIIFSCLAIILIQALRSECVGTDISGYLTSLDMTKYYNFLKGEKLLNYEIGYSIYSQIFASLNVSHNLYLGIVATTIIVPIGYVWYKYSSMPIISIIIYITLGFFTFSFSGIRQAIAISIVFFSFKYIEKRKLKNFILIIILAMSFHKTAIIFIPAYWIYNIKIQKQHLIFIIPILLIVFLLRSKIFAIIYMLWRKNEYIHTDTNAFTMLFVMIFVYSLSIVLINRNNDSKISNAYRNFMLMAIIVQIFASVSTTIMRAGYYYYIFITLLIPDVISKQKDKGFKVIGIIILLILLVMFYHITTSNGYLNVVPYKFFWEY